MARYFKFVWRCAKDAWRGSFVLANAWYGLWGPVLVWLVWKYWRGTPLTLPDRLDGYAIGLLFAFLGATWVGLLVFRFLLAPSKLYWEQHDRAEQFQTQLNAAEGADSGPNWPIREVFFYLEPEVLDRPKDNLWENAGTKIRDALTLGRIKIWGRLSKTKLGDWVGEPSALRPIEPKYWEKAFFTYLFFDDRAKDDATYCYADRNTGVPAYTDLQVNRAEVLKVWPGDPGDIAESYANVRVADSPAVIELFEGRERTKLIGLLNSNKLTTWVRPSNGIGRDLETAEGKIWGSHTFQFMSKRDDDSGTINQTYLRPRFNPNSSHYDICLNYAQLKRAWPDLQINRTACDIR
ncbi:MAG TPA: hypothetical protein VMV19_01830 [Xanthobacteraceae bacterium]|nr:hypothetical protein [Xanthobacteraceae bacterium]